MAWRRRSIGALVDQTQAVIPYPGTLEVPGAVSGPQRPVGSFLFLAHRGGKTELAVPLRSSSSKRRGLGSFEMSEFWSATRGQTVGAPPGYVGFEEGG